MLTALLVYVICSYVIWIVVLPMVALLSERFGRSIYWGVVAMWLVCIPIAPIALPYAIYNYFRWR